MRTALRTILVMAVIAALFSPAPASSAPDCQSVYADTYDIRFEVDDVRYEVGEDVDVDVWVTRKNTGQPVSGANVAVGIFQRNNRKGYSYQMSMTNAFGLAQADLKVRRHFQPGWVDLASRAWTQHVNAGVACADVVEYGFKMERRAIRITR